ncbi:MAG: type II toxin-antitoxin system VapC family toxin [Candidatus Helarchaeota archaeon]
MILVDTNFLIDVLRKKQEIKSFLAANPDEILFTTEFNIFELYLGLYSSKILEKNSVLLKKRLQKLDELISRLQILPFKRKEAIKSAEILGTLTRRGQKIDFRDGIIAGIALANGITTILTKNVTHFNRIDDLTPRTY